MIPLLQSLPLDGARGACVGVSLGHRSDPESWCDRVCRQVHLGKDGRRKSPALSFVQELPQDSNEPGNDRSPAEFQGGNAPQWQSKLCPFVRSPAEAGETGVWATHNRQNQPAVPLQRTGKPESQVVHSLASILAGRGEKNGVAPVVCGFDNPNPSGRKIPARFRAADFVKRGRVATTFQDANLSGSSSGQQSLKPRRGFW